jgi:hypothetical protein
MLRKSLIALAAATALGLGAGAVISLPAWEPASLV